MSDKNHYILFVDDDEDEQFLVRECCEQLQLSAEAHFVTSGEVAFRFLSSVSTDEAFPALIVLDINMPGMRGDEVLLRLKRDTRYQHIPVVIRSTAAYHCETYRSLGADGFIQKAYTYAQLEQNVAAIFRRLQLG